MIVRKFLRTVSALIASYFIIFLVFHQWYLKADMPLATVEWLALQPERLHDYVSRPFIWDDAYGGSYDLYSLANYYKFLTVGLLSLMGLSFPVIEKIIWGSAPFIAVTAMYMLCYYLFKERFPSVIASLFFVVNPYFLIQAIMGRLSQLMAISLSPLILYFFMNMWEKGSMKDALLLSLFLTITFSYEGRYTLVSFIAILIYIITSLIFDTKKFRLNIKYLLFVFWCFLGFNLFWIAPYIFYRKLELGYPITYTQLKSFSSSLLDAFELVTPQWFGPNFTSPIPYFQPEIVPVLRILLIIPPLIASFSLLRSKNSRILFLTLLYIVALFLSKGANRPSGDINALIYLHVPGFEYFRVSSRFFALSMLALSPLIGYSVKYLGGIDTIVKRRPGVKLAALIFLFSVLLSSNAYPILFGHVGGTFDPQPIPAGYEIVNNFIKNSKAQRFLFIPTIGLYASFSREKQVIDEFSFGRDARYLLYYSLERWNTDLAPIYAKVLGIFGAQYLIIPPDVEKYGSSPFVVWHSRPYYIELLDSLVGVRPVLTTKDVSIYENPYSLPRIFAAKHILLVVGSKKALFELSSHSINFSSTVIFFVDQLRERSLKIIDKADAVVFYRTNMTDLLLASLDENYRVNLWKVAGEYGLTDGWVKDYGYADAEFTVSNGEMIHNPNGLILSTKPSATLNVTISVKDSAAYYIWLRAGTITPGSLEFRLEDWQKTILLNQTRELHYYKIGAFQLQKEQTYNVRITSNNADIVIDEIIVVPVQEIDRLEKFLTLNLPEYRQLHLSEWTNDLDKVLARNDSYDLSYRKLAPTKYEIRLGNQSDVKCIVFSETYDKGWKLQSMNKIYDSLPAFGVLNGFIIEKAEKDTFELSFEPQKYVDWGILIQAMILLMLVVTVSIIRIMNRKPS